MEQLAENILSWCKNLEPAAMQQVQNLSKHPCLVGNVCLMPDAHCGYGMPIGGVVALDNAISPNMVGVDIGCGMLAVQTSLTDITRDKVQAIVDKIYDRVPVGFTHHKEAQENPLFQDLTRWNKTEVCKREFFSAQKQIGTLGGGNHFIEIQRGSDGHIWFMIHSGSRNLGKQVAEYYNDKAVKLCTMFKQEEIAKQDLAFLPIGTREAGDYINEMKLCLDFAFENRKMIATSIKKVFLEEFPQAEFVQEINIHHNYAAAEEHYNRKVWVHRKGATLARENTTGIIPGSQGTSSYIVQGLGNESSLQSCSHGAGRCMSRSRAMKDLDLAHEQEILNSQGIVHRMNEQGLLDEAPSAYKNIDEVMENQKDLVKILVKLTPLGVVKASNEPKPWQKKAKKEK
ncbi:MAG: RtcB family protein [Elusimicrobiaceae bacterium]|nr:RtcB family protein [Elusimicrobiaceae bacterium]